MIVIAKTKRYLDKPKELHWNGIITNINGIDFYGIKEYPSYGVSKCGKVANLRDKKLLTLYKNYRYNKANTFEYQVILVNKKKSDKWLVHRILGFIFLHEEFTKLKIEHPNEQLTINHIDENPSNNNINNLEWLTKGDNIRAYRANAEKHVRDFGADDFQIFDEGKIRCLMCKNLESNIPYNGELFYCTSMNQGLRAVSKNEKCDKFIPKDA